MKLRRPSYRVGESIPGTRYRFVDVIGEGGQGVVYRVEHEYLQVPCVMKLVHPELVDDEEIAMRAAREARTLAKLKHPNIVQVTDGGLTAEPIPRPFFVMEELNGVSFRDALRKLGGRIGVGPVAALDLIAGVLEGLRFAHAAGVVHRDIKPENLFIHRTDMGSVPKILDFGIAHLARGGKRVTGQHFIGTPRYASPEQINGQPLTDQSDLYSVGLVLYELITGEQPYSHIAPRDMGAICAAHLLEPLPDVATRVPGLPGAIPSILKWLVEKKPADRCPNAFAALTILREARARIDDTVTGAIHQADFQTQPTPMENLLLTESRTEDPSVIEVSERAPVLGNINDTTPDGPPIFDTFPRSPSPPVAAAQPLVRRTARMQPSPPPRAVVDRRAETAVRPVGPVVRQPPRFDTEPLASPLAFAETSPPSRPSNEMPTFGTAAKSTTVPGVSMTTKIKTTLERRPVVRGLVYLAAACGLALVLLPIVMALGKRTGTPEKAPAQSTPAMTPRAPAPSAAPQSAAAPTAPPATAASTAAPGAIVPSTSAIAALPSATAATNTAATSFAVPPAVTPRVAPPARTAAVPAKASATSPSKTDLIPFE